MERTMKKPMMKLAATATGLLVATSFAQDKKPMTPAQTEVVAQVKSKAMKERQSMMNKTKAIGDQVAGIQKSLTRMDQDKVAGLQAQVVALQKSVDELQAQLANAPHYFDDPLADPIRD